MDQWVLSRKSEAADERALDPVGRYTKTWALERQLKPVRRRSISRTESDASLASGLGRARSGSGRASSGSGRTGSSLSDDDDGLVPVRLLKASWLAAQGNNMVNDLPHRKILEFQHPEAFLDEEQTSAVLSEVRDAAQSGSAVMWYPPLLVVSYAWRTPTHPDPTGSLLFQLSIVLEWYLSERARLMEDGEVKTHECGVFIDFWSIYQQSTDPIELSVFKSALMSMDAWFGHAGTVTLLMTRLPADWGLVPPDRTYHSRGWCFFERQVSSLAKVATHTLECGQFDRERLVELYPQASTIGDGNFDSKDVRALAKQASGEDRGGSPFLKTLIGSARLGPVHPDRFANALVMKAFSNEDDRDYVTHLYGTVARGVLCSTAATSYSHMHWSHDDCTNFSHSLKLCVKLETLRLNNCGITFTHLRALLGELSVDDLPELTELQLKENPLGDEGIRILTHAISVNYFPKLASLLLKDNDASDSALGQLADVCAMRNIDIAQVTTMWASVREKGRELSEFRRAQLRRGSSASHLASLAISAMNEAREATRQRVRRKSRGELSTADSLDSTDLAKSATPDSRRPSLLLRRGSKGSGAQLGKSPGRSSSGKDLIATASITTPALRTIASGEVISDPGDELARRLRELSPTDEGSSMPLRSAMKRKGDENWKLLRTTVMATAAFKNAPNESRKRVSFTRPDEDGDPGDLPITPTKQPSFKDLLAEQEQKAAAAPDMKVP